LLKCDGLVLRLCVAGSTILLGEWLKGCVGSAVVWGRVAASAKGTASIGTESACSGVDIGGAKSAAGVSATEKATASCCCCAKASWLALAK